MPCLSFIHSSSPRLPKPLRTLGFIYKLAVKCCSLFDSLQLIAHNLFRLQDAPFINDDIFQKAVQLAALHIACIFHISKTGHMQNHFTVAQRHKQRKDDLEERPEVLFLILPLTCCRLWVSRLLLPLLHLHKVVYSSKRWNSVNETLIYYY